MKRLAYSLPIATAIITLVSAAAQTARADAVVAFNEVMYHPATNESTMEWVELKNMLAVDIDMSGWAIGGTINYTFPSNSIIRARSHLVVAISPATLMAQTGLTGVLGPFTSRLDNDGGTIELRNNSGRLIDEVSYQVDNDWPVAADGSGAALAKRDPDSSSGSAANWAASEQPGGTPGAVNFPAGNVVLPDTRLLEVTALWKYEASGIDLGTDWRTTGYNDAGWASRSNLATRAITNLYNTGVGDNRLSLAAGANDPHYILSSGPQGTIGAPALVIQNHPAWLANNTVSSFIGVLNPGSSSILGGTYGFRTTFSLAGLVPGTARLNLDVAVDNTVSDVLINGSASGLTTSGFAAFNPTLTLSNGFVSGNNTLEFRAVNEGDGPGGFRAQVSGSGLGANTAAPLPAGRSTYYFRRSFNFNQNPALTRLRINPILGDGAVIYLNGTEVFRQNMPAGSVSYATPALSDVASPDFSGLVEISAASLVSGVNVLAVEVHQAAAGADEPWLGLELISTPLPPPSSAPVTLSFSEVSAPTNNPFFIEIVNTGASAIALGNLTLEHDGPTNHTYAFPASDLAPGALTIVTANDLGFTPAVGDKFYLTQTSSGRVVDAVLVKNRNLARAPRITSPWVWSSAATPGAANVVNFRNEIVINEVMHSPALLPGTNGVPESSPEEWLELHNRSGNAIDLAGWRLSGGISYLFVAGQSIPAGGYLVVANDVPYVKAQYPAATVVGDYGGRLGGSDHVVLRDPSGNIADEIRYHTGENWPVYSGGGGSSLELRDPASDNTKPESWAASDESANGGWRNYSYRMVAAIPAGSGQPTTWQDFILGLQGAGECLIDDISVIESPTNAPIQVISNGDFEGGITGWRVLGTHNRSGVITDPDNAGNKVLRIVATGPQEHMHNHIERTLNAGRTITAGRLYEISFRARWTAGNNLLNTRLYFNRVARTHALPMPALGGTPGAQNSRFVANAGPTFSSFGHTRVVPAAGEPVTVSVIAEDPNGVNTTEVFWSVNSGAWQSAAMTHQGAGIYIGTIPGQAAAAVVQFYVRAVDGLGAAATYPARGTNSGALYKVNDGLANVALTSNVRIIFTPENINFMHGTAQGANQTNVMSNDLIPCTVIYNEQRAYYDVGAHLRGSQRGRYSDVRTGYHINFHPDELFRGAHPVMLVDRSGAGDTTSNRQEEILLKHMLNRAGGLPGTYGEICHLLAPRNAWNGAAQFFPRHEDVFVDTTFGGGGRQFEMELIYYPTTTNSVGYKLPQPDAVVGTDMTNLGDDKEIYRYNFMLKGGRYEDDYRSFIRLCKAWSQSGPALDLQTRELMDIDQWMRAYAFISLGSIGDMYTFGNNHNFFTYQRPDGKYIYFPWDMDFSFNRGETAALVGDQNLGKIVSLPGNLRLMYAHMLDIIDVCFNSGYMASWVTHYQGISQGQNFAPRTSYIQNRANYARTQINSQTGTNFTVAGTNNITTANNTIVLSGNAPAAVRSIKINGVEYPITWTSVAGWRVVVSVSDPTTVLNIAAYDLKGRLLPNFNRTVTVNYTGGTPDAEKAVVINEIMYNPALPDAAYVEIFNPSPDTSVNLSGWRINGIDYTFPSGAVITNRQHLLLIANIIGYHAAFGTNSPAPFGVFDGNLQNDGETLTLLKPGTLPGTEIVIDKVRYEGVAPWPVTANGTGPALQLIDASRDNSRVGNWSDGSGWKFFSLTRTSGSAAATNLSFFFQAASQPGDIFLDDVALVEGNTPGAGPNLLQNGGFEEPFAPAWGVRGQATNSVITTAVAHSGLASAHVRFAGGTLGLTNFAQAIPALTTNTLYTLSFWYLSGSAGSNFAFRINTTFNSSFDPRPTGFSPGAPNTAAASLPAFPELWLNELQAENLSGLADNQGEREPWLELFNAGTTPISLDGYALADNYSNLGQWTFPPGAVIQPGEFKIVIADGEPGESTAGEWHTSFRLNAGHGSVALSWSPEGSLRVLDYLNYTNLVAGRSYGDFPDGQPFDRQEFYRVTAGGTNDNAAPPIVAYINEWMASNTRTLINTNNGNRYDDWFEIHNPGNTPVNLAGYYLTDNLNNPLQFQIPAGYVIPPHGYLLVWADNRPNLNTNTDPALHASFRLDESGEAIGLFAADGTAIDIADFSAQQQFEDYSAGRFPDGQSPIYILSVPTPNAPNQIWANRYPVLAPIADATVFGGETFAFTASAGDPDLPPQTLTFTLSASAPLGAVIDAATGAFSWAPSTNQVPSTNQITVRVTDSGTPALTTSRTFQVIARPGFRLSNISRQPNGDVTFTIGATLGKTYRVEFKDDLNQPDWVTLGADRVADGASLLITDNVGANPQRLYRVRQLD